MPRHWRMGGSSAQGLAHAGHSRKSACITPLHECHHSCIDRARREHIRLGRGFHRHCIPACFRYYLPACLLCYTYTYSSNQTSPHLLIFSPTILRIASISCKCSKCHPLRSGLIPPPKPSLRASPDYFTESVK